MSCKLVRNAVIVEDGGRIRANVVLENNTIHFNSKFSYERTEIITLPSIGLELQSLKNDTFP